MLPRVVIHNAVSADGRTLGFAANLDLFYKLAARWDEDVTLAGSNTILAALQQPAEKDSDGASEETSPGAAPDKPQGGTLAVVDSRGRIKNWRQVKRWPFWSRHVSVCAESTPSQHFAYLRYQEVDALAAGDKRVDLRLALEELNRLYAARTVRVESGGTLNAALLRQGLVDEVSILVHPTLVGGMSPPTIFRTLDLPQPIDLDLAGCQELDDKYVWLRYDVKKSASTFAVSDEKAFVRT